MKILQKQSNKYSSGQRAVTLAEKELAVHRLLEVWAQVPELRLGQMIYVAVFGKNPVDLFNVEDGELLQRLERLISEDE